MKLKILLTMLLGAFVTSSPILAKSALTTSAYDFSFLTLNSKKPLPITQFKGKVILVVNTASKCGFTSQYRGLETLYQTYKDKGLVVIGVPSNDFGSQEPGTSEDIGTFCEINYGVTFPLTEKEKVVGKEAHPFYKWTKEKLGMTSVPRWNFHKILINKNGEAVDSFFSTTGPESTALIKAIEKELQQPYKEKL